MLDSLNSFTPAKRLAALLAAGLFSLAAAGPVQAEPSHAISLHGAPELPAGYTHLPYARPDAPKGGRLTIGSFGAFDSLNPFIIKGTVPEGIVPYVVQPLMMRSLDEPFTLYGLVAETVELAPDGSWMELVINPKARFSDHKPVTAEDVAHTFELIKDKGRPLQRAAYRRITRVEIRAERVIRFHLPGGERELPLLIGLMPVLAKHDMTPEKFEQTSLAAPLGTGPYLAENVKPGASFTLKRIKDHWAGDVPAVRGFYNFDEIRYDFYREANAMLEAFKSELYDLRTETDPSKWLGGYDFPAVRDGRITREALRFEAPKAMNGLVFNTRRPQFSDIRVREALTALLDFEWLNRSLFSNAFTRTGSYFSDSALSALGSPADARELKLLEAFPGAVRPDILAGAWRPPVSDGSGRDRALQQQAMTLLQAAGYQAAGGALRGKDNQPLSFEILVLNREQQRIALTYADQIKRAGIEPRIRLVDGAEYWRRLRAFDFDMIIWQYSVTASPGNEQANRFASAAADREGALNFAGVRSPAVDAMIQALLAARSREDFTSAVRALDRALMSGFYILPLFHLKERWVARSSSLARPERLPRFEMTTDTWWRKPAAP